MRKGAAQHCFRQSLTVKGIFHSMPDNTPAMPLTEAHFGGFFVSGGRV